MLRDCDLDRHPTPSNNRAAGPEALVCVPASGVYRVLEAQARAQAVRKVIVMS